MASYVAPSAFTKFLLLAITFLVNLPISSCAYDFQYYKCIGSFDCGDLKSITYPFWGSDKPEYCGHPDLELKCSNSSAEIEIESQSYRVLQIDPESKSLRIATINSWKDNCPLRVVNTSFPSKLFNYSNSNSTTVNMTLFYNCPSIPVMSKNRFDCSVNDTYSNNYFWIDYMEETSRLENLSRCGVSFVVQVLQTVVQKFTSSESTLEEVLKNGFDVEYLTDVSSCDRCTSSDGSCGYDLNSTQPICFCRNGTSSNSSCLPYDNFWIDWAGIIGLYGLASVGFISMIIGVTCCWKKKKTVMKALHFWKKNKKSRRMVEIFLRNYGSLAPKRYDYCDIKKITNSFKEKIGQGGYGGVYKGKLVDHRVVAVKLLNKAKGDGEEFINEVASISNTSHVNIVGLLGFCFDGSKRALVYEFMANGSLEKFIYDHNPLETQIHLTWEILHKISLGVARGLEYLHRGCNTRILHFDIKPHNILLDQDFIPKISDFGLAKVCTREESIISMLGARGTIGFIAPEVFSRNFGAVSHKPDVYSYGMMVLEMVGRRKNLDVGVNHTSEIYFPNWVYKRLEQADLGLSGDMSKAEEEIARKMILVALWCIQTNPMDRPAISEVVEMLDGKHVSIPPKPCLSSPPRSPVASSKDNEIQE